MISALREFEWTAVKITGHDYGRAGIGARNDEPVIREESVAGEETDTARYLAAGARRALLVTRFGDEVPAAEIQRALGDDHNVIFESNRVVDVLKPDLCLALIGGDNRKPSFERLLQVADAVLTVHGCSSENLPKGIQRFELASLDRLPAELPRWMRVRLNQK